MTKSAFETQVGGNHYKGFKIEPFVFFHANNIPHHKATIIRRILRYDLPSGDGLQDLEKIQHEVELIKELEYPKDQQACSRKKEYDDVKSAMAAEQLKKPDIFEKFVFPVPGESLSQILKDMMVSSVNEMEVHIFKNGACVQPTSAEQEARNMLGRMGYADAQTRTAGALVELANLINRKKCTEVPPEDAAKFISIQGEDDEFVVDIEALKNYLLNPTPPAEKNIIEALRALQHAVHENAKNHGWHDKDAPSSQDGYMLANIHREVAELFDALAHGNPPDKHCPEYSSAEVEGADILLRLCDLFGRKGWNIGKVALAKHKYNLTREYRHGKLF